MYKNILPSVILILCAYTYYFHFLQSRPRPKRKSLDAETRNNLRYKLPIPSKPTDDVYLTWCYEKPVYEAEELLDMLKKFQQLEFVSPNQPVYANLTLDMALDKVCRKSTLLAYSISPFLLLILILQSLL